MRNYSRATFLLVIAIALAVSWIVAGQNSTPGGTVTRPPSSIEKPGDTGGHTNVEIFTPKQPVSPAPPPKEFFNPEEPNPKFEPPKVKREPNCSGLQLQEPGC